MSRIIKLGLIYFSLVFAAGFLLGTIRVLFVVPEIGERYAELIEMPIMLFAIYYSARFIVRKVEKGEVVSTYLYVGILSLMILLMFEFTIVLGLQGISIKQYLASRDPVSGAVYVLSLIVYMLMPLLIARRQV